MKQFETETSKNEYSRLNHGRLKRLRMNRIARQFINLIKQTNQYSYQYLYVLSQAPKKYLYPKMAAGRLFKMRCELHQSTARQTSTFTSRTNHWVFVSFQIKIHFFLTFFLKPVFLERHFKIEIKICQQKFTYMFTFCLIFVNKTPFKNLWVLKFFLALQVNKLESCQLKMKISV